MRPKGFNHTEQTKQKMSKSAMGSRNHMYGKHHTEETKRKIGTKSKGRVHSKETRKKMSMTKIGKKHSEETNRKLSQSISGENHWNWKGGVSGAIAKRLQNYKWRALATKIRKRDNHWCLYCRDARGTDVHHMLPPRLGGTDDETNLVALCRSCHSFIERKIIG